LNWLFILIYLRVTGSRETPHEIASPFLKLERITWNEKYYDL